MPADWLCLWFGWATALLLVSLAPARIAHAEDPPATTRSDALPRIQVPRVEKGPSVDGSLDDPIWQRGVLLQTLIQSEPNQGQPVSERTEIRLLRDDDALYFAIRCYDSEPDRIVAQKMLRDESLNSEDRISISLDTFRDRRNGYFFQINPLGAKRDGLIENGRLELDWDGIWYAEARLDDEGWVLELALPFKTFSFDPEGDEWGLKILRGISRKGERARWSEPFPDSSFVNLATAGALEGMGDLEVGWGLDVIPSLAIRTISEPSDGTTRVKVDPSVDIFYRVTPAITAALTANTDFAETAVDEQQVNLSRFSLFFPEKREFFLRDAGIFEFGGLEGNGRPFFSRKIGLDEAGDPYDVHVGGKLTGRRGRFNIGVLDTYVSDHGSVSAKNLFVGRVSANVLEESQIGVIATNGNPECDVSNTLVGGDFLYQNSQIFPQRSLTGRLWYQHSVTGDREPQDGCDEQQPEGSGAGFGARVSYPNDKINWAIGAKEIQHDFFPALGFVNRVDIREYDASYRYRMRPTQQGSRLLTADMRSDGVLVTNTDNEVDSATLHVFPIDLDSDRGDGLEVFYFYRHERLSEAFEIVDGVTLPIGRYDWHGGGARLIVGESRPLSGQVDASFGGFYGGNRLQLKGLVRWRPSRHILLSGEYDHSEIHLPEGDFAVRIARARFNLQFSVDLSWNTFVQYDNISDSMGISSRVRWIIEPGRELFVVFNQDLLVEAGDVMRGRTEPIVKLGWTFRF